MSDAIVCDQCGNTLRVDHHREDADGESAGWLRLTLANENFDLCTRACLHEFIDSPEVIAAHDAQLEVITDIARSIRDGRADEDPS